MSTQMPIDTWSPEKIEAAREQFTRWWQELQSMRAEKKAEAKRYLGEISELEQTMDVLAKELEEQEAMRGSLAAP